MLTVGFDLDMTLVDSRPGIRASMSALARETGVAIDVGVVLGRLGPKLEWELGQWFPEDQVDAMSKRYRDLYWDDCAGDGTLLLPGIRRHAFHRVRQLRTGTKTGALSSLMDPW